VEDPMIYNKPYQADIDDEDEEDEEVKWPDYSEDVELSDLEVLPTNSSPEASEVGLLNYEKREQQTCQSQRHYLWHLPQRP
jgi:hypothetical protein